MQGADLLQTMAQIAVALAGFSTVVAVFNRPSSGQWSKSDLFRLAHMVESSLSALFLCLVPLFLAALHFEERVVWVASSLMLIVCMIAILVAASRQRGLVDSRDRAALSTWVGLVLIAITVAVIGLQLMNLFGLVYEQESGPYIVGVGGLLLNAGIQFGRLLFVGAGDDN